MGRIVFETQFAGSIECAEAIEEVLTKTVWEVRKEQRKSDSRWLYQVVLNNPSIKYVGVFKEAPADALLVIRRYTFRAYVVMRNGRGKLAGVKVKMLYLVPR